MTPMEAAAYLRVKRDTIYRWCRTGRLRYYELETGGGRRFDRADLDALLRPTMGRPRKYDEASGRAGKPHPS